jgi:hypothetical protein
MSYVEDYRIHARSPRYQVLEALARIHEGMKAQRALVTCNGKGSVIGLRRALKEKAHCAKRTIQASYMGNTEA